MEFAFVLDTSKGFEEAVVSLRRSVEAAKWGILGSYDFSEILASKGFPQENRYKSLDICQPAHADKLLAANQLTALCMPCKALVYTEGKQTKIAAMRPGVVIPGVFGSKLPNLSEYTATIDEELNAILLAAM